MKESRCLSNTEIYGEVAHSDCLHLFETQFVGDLCSVCVTVFRTNVVFLLAGDGVAANLSVLDGRQVPNQRELMKTMLNIETKHCVFGALKLMQI